MADAVLTHLVAERGWSDRVHVDSAGTGGWHAGEGADPRTIACLRAKGIRCPSIARQVRVQDFQDFDLILAMDAGHLVELRNWRGARPERVRLFLNEDVPDPYYGGPDGFELIYSMIREGCEDLLDSLEPRMAG